MPEALIDSHVHLDTFADRNRMEEMLEAAVAAGVRRMIAIGGSPPANDRALDWSARRTELFAAVGLDRDEATKDADWDLLSDRIQRPRVVAVGECGLDYFYSPDSATAQRRCFEGNLNLALEAGLPVVVHTRDADEDTLAILRAHARAWPHDPARIGVLHCYTRDKAMAGKLIDLGYAISFSGILTFASADMLRGVAAYVPSDRLLVETDSPFLAPVPMRGKTNQPAYLPHIVRKLAECRGEPEEEIARFTTRNAELLFNLPGQSPDTACR